MKKIKNKLFSKEKVEIGPNSGYDNYITFYRNFVKYTGASPAKFSEIPENRTYD